MAMRPLYMGLHFYLPQATASLTHVGAVAHARYMVSPKKEELVRSSDPGIHARYMQVKNLPPVDTVCGQQIVGRCQGGATSRALRRHMRDPLIGFLAYFQLGPWVPHWTPTGATTFTAKTFGFGRWARFLPRCRRRSNMDRAFTPRARWNLRLRGGHR